MSEVQRVPDTSFWLGADGVPAHHVQATIRFDAGPAIERLRVAVNGLRSGGAIRHLAPGEHLAVNPAKERQWIDMAETAGIISQSEAALRRAELPPPNAPSRYHFLNEDPFTIKTEEGLIEIRKGWLAITEAEYADLRSKAGTQS